MEILSGLVVAVYARTRANGLATSTAVLGVRCGWSTTWKTTYIRRDIYINGLIGAKHDYLDVGHGLLASMTSVTWAVHQNVSHAVPWFSEVKSTNNGTSQV